MTDKYDISGDILVYLRDNHIGAENAVTSADIEHIFKINGAAVRQSVNRLRCDGQPVCSNVNGYFYAKNADEINDTIQQLRGRTQKITDAAQGLVLSRQVLHGGGDGS
jgi:biotin operon repressor